jgi:hypothetical protein
MELGPWKRLIRKNIREIDEFRQIMFFKTTREYHFGNSLYEEKLIRSVFFVIDYDKGTYSKLN